MRKILKCFVVLALLSFVTERANAQYWILPKATNGTSTAWSYLEASLDDGLSAGYESATFDYSSWAIGQSGFGINTDKKDWYGTIYSGAQGLWIRKKVTLDVQDLSSLKFELIYDEDPVIYINGTEVYRTTGWHDGSYKDITATINKTTLNLQGDNEIAIHFVPGGGGSCLDFSIYCTEEPPTLEAYITDAKASLATITPADHHDNDPARNRSFLLGNERTSVDGLATCKDHLANLQAALDVIEAAHAAGKTKSQVPDELAALAAAKAVVDAKSNPLVDGYYYLVAEYDNGTDGIPGGFVIGSNENGIAKVEYNATNPMQMFKVEYDAVNGKVYLQNVATEKWLGVVDGSAWKQSDTKVALNVMSGKNHNWYWGSPKNDAARSCSFILSNDEGKGISSSNCGVANDVTNTSAQAWFISWAFRPADEAYNAYMAEKDFNDLMAAADEALTTVTPANHHDNTGTRSFLLGNEKTSIDGLATSKDAKDALQAARDAVYNGYRTDGKTLDQLSTEIATLNAAITTVNAKSNPLVDGYYYIVAEVDADANGVPGGWVMRKSGNHNKIGRAHYNSNDIKQIFKVTYDQANGKIILQNVASGLYVGVVDGSQWYFTSEATTMNVKTGSPFYWVHSAETTKAARSCSFVLYNDNNKCIDNAVENSTTYGDASNEGTWGWRISWAFRPADAYLAKGPLKMTLDKLADAYTTIEGSDNPGEYAAAGVEAFKALYASDVTAYNGGENTLTIEEQLTMANALDAAYESAISTTNLLTDGYYRVISAYPTSGNKLALYIDTNGTIGWKQYDATNALQFVFKLTDQAVSWGNDSGTTSYAYSMQNLYSGKYVGSGVWTESDKDGMNKDATSTDDPYNIAITQTNVKPQFILQPRRINDSGFAQGLTVQGDLSSGSGTVRQTVWCGSVLAGDLNGCWKFEKVEPFSIPEDGSAVIYADDDVTLADITEALEGQTYSSIDLSGVTLDPSVTAADIASLQTGNMLVVVPSTSGITGTNIVNNGVCESLVLTDGNTLTVPTTFTATNATYTRPMTNQWGTVCLPYAVSSTAALKYYNITGVENGALVVSELATLPAGTPALVCKLTGDGITATATNAPISATINNTTGSVTMYGVFEQTQVNDASAYYIKDNKFWKCNNYFNCGAFRAYFTISGSTSPFFSILIGDDDPTAIGSATTDTDAANAAGIYGVDGKKYSTLQPGINIIKMSNGKTQKIIKK